VDKTKQYYTAEKKVLKKGYGELAIVEVCNHRKEKECEAKFLIRYNSGQRDWCSIGAVLYEVSELAEVYMKDCKLTWETLGYDINNQNKVNEQDNDETKSNETLTETNETNETTIDNNKRNEIENNGSNEKDIENNGINEKTVENNDINETTVDGN
jgi:hypothetical protein